MFQTWVLPHFPGAGVLGVPRPHVCQDWMVELISTIFYKFINTGSDISIRINIGLEFIHL